MNPKPELMEPKISAAPHRRLTVAEYLAIERASEQKHEFVNGEVFAMAGASRQHNEIKENLSIEIGGRLKGGSCRTYSGDRRVKVERDGQPFYTYPDYLIVSGPPQFVRELGLDTLLNPLVIIEILSDSTEDYDRREKFEYYRQLASLREYVLISQKRMEVEQLVRGPDDGWEPTVLQGADSELVLATAPVRLPLFDLYRGVELPGKG
jgi:Uma2 family endonuclease